MNEKSSRMIPADEPKTRLAELELENMALKEEIRILKWEKRRGKTMTQAQTDEERFW